MHLASFGDKLLKLHFGLIQLVGLVLKSTYDPADDLNFVWVDPNKIKFGSPKPDLLKVTIQDHDRVGRRPSQSRTKNNSQLLKKPLHDLKNYAGDRERRLITPSEIYILILKI